MLPPEYLAELPETILKLWREAELAILRDMARRISTYDYWIPAADYQNEKLLEAGRTQAEILAVLAKTTKKSEAELREMMVDAGSRCLRNDVEVYTASGLKAPAIGESQALTDILNAGYRATAQTMRNITKTTAQTATRQFEGVLDRAWLQVSSGAFDADSAIRQAVKELSANGIDAIRYPASGHVDTIETAVRRAIVTGVNQTAAKLQEELADELGCDLVEVSAHAGARPEHAAWQGKVYSRSGTSEKYPDFRSSTGYGTGAGLCGWNCRHTFGPYIEGSPRVWTDEKLAELSAPKYEYQGEKFTEYEARQKEKYFDRQIYRWQREAEAMRAAGQDPAQAQAKVKAWRAREKDFLENRTEIVRTQKAAPARPDFTPAKTISEAEAFAAKFTNGGKYSKVSYSGIDLKYANEFNRAMNDVLTQYEPKYKLQNIEAMNMRTKAFQGTTADAAYRWGSNDLFYNKAYFKSERELAKHIAQYNELMAQTLPNVDMLIDKYRQDTGYLAGKQLAYVEALKASGRANVSGGDPYGTMVHELAHYLDDTLFRRVFKEAGFDLRSSYEQFSVNVSAYATESNREYVAESFLAYWNGETDRLDHKLVEIFEGARK